MFSWSGKFRYNWMEAVALGNRAMASSCTVVRLAKVTAVLLKSYNELKEKAWTSFTLASMQQARGTSWLRGKRCYLNEVAAVAISPPKWSPPSAGKGTANSTTGLVCVCVCVCACVCVCVCVCLRARGQLDICWTAIVMGFNAYWAALPTGVCMA